MWTLRFVEARWVEFLLRQWCIAGSAPGGRHPLWVVGWTTRLVSPPPRHLRNDATNATQHGCEPACKDAMTSVAATASTCLHGPHGPLLHFVQTGRITYRNAARGRGTAVHEKSSVNLGGVVPEICSRADRQTKSNTQTDTLIALLRHPYRERSN